MTERLLIDAGIGAGMCVLDVGCGRGDVSFLAARLVGEQGQVLGVDRDSRVLATARERAFELGIASVNFVEADFTALSPEHTGFDAVVGRRVLMYQPDPVEAVRGLARALRPGGLHAAPDNTRPRHQFYMRRPDARIVSARRLGQHATQARGRATVRPARCHWPRHCRDRSIFDHVLLLRCSTPCVTAVAYTRTQP